MTAPRSEQDHVAGVDADAATAWLLDHVPHLEPPLTFDRLAGGRSNITVRVRDQVGGSVVLRRPPTVGVLPSAHDMAREHLVLSALADTAVPVPRPVALCEDESVLGAEFYVMEDVPGRILRSSADTAQLSQSMRTAVSGSVVATLAVLHQVDATSGPMTRLGRPHNYVERQLRRLSSQLEKSATRDLPLARRVHDALAADVPTQQRTALVHGDYRLDNLIIAEDGTVRAVLDWELCTRGDPLADLAMLCVYWLDPGEEPIPTLSSPTDHRGFLRRDELVERYAAATGLEVTALPFYMSFALWKLAIILEGVYARYLSGAYEDAVGGYEQLGAAVPRLLERAAATVVRD